MSKLAVLPGVATPQFGRTLDPTQQRVIRLPIGQSSEANDTGDDPLSDPVTINFSVPVEAPSVAELNSALRQAARVKKQTGGSIKLVINTPGGDIQSGFQVTDFVDHLGVPVDTVLLGGQAASMGAILFLLAGTGRRIMTPNARLMIHEPRIMTEGPSMFTASSIKELDASLSQMKKKLDLMVSKRTGLPLEKVAEMTCKDTYLDPLQALKLGFATHVLMGDGRALTAESIKNLSDDDLHERDLANDYDGLKTFALDPQIADASKISRAQRASALGGQDLGDLDGGRLLRILSPGQAGAYESNQKSANQLPSEPKIVLMA